LVEMVEAPYEAEAVLQKLLADYPGLLAGDRDDEERRRWLLISRELGIGSDPEGSARWSLDYLFVDQEGIPTLVEVKRSSDTRIRREVVGQMLDYAANGAKVWSQETIRSSFYEARTNPDDDLVDFLGHGMSTDLFWGKVGTNLKAGRLRLVFVADEIPSELQRVIEFLNEQMTSTEVLALEIKQYKELGEGERLTLVPRIIGQTETARQVKGATSREITKWTEQDFKEAVARAQPANLARRMNALVDALAAEGASIFPGSGKDPSLNMWLGQTKNPSAHPPVAVSFYLKGIAINLPFVRDYRSESDMKRLVRLVREIPGASGYFEGLEELQFRYGMKPNMDPKDVLATDDSVALFSQKLIEASRPPA